MEKQKSKNIGQVKTIACNLNEPEMKTEFDVNQLNIFVGTNGVGKSFLLALNWAICYSSNIIILSRGHPVSPTAFAQFVFDKTFDLQLDGSATLIFTSGAEVTVTLEKGKVISVDSKGMDEITEATQVIYMSAGMRTFESISLYLRLRKATGETNPEMIIYRMAENFKLYDVMYIEGLIVRMPIGYAEGRFEHINNMVNENERNGEIVGIGVDLDKCDFYAVVSPNKDKVEDYPMDDKRLWKYLSTYSKGEQAWINMFLIKSLNR